MADNLLTERRIYHENYYSGPQIKIFLNGVWVDDIVRLEYSLSQSKKPLYGYASQYFDAVAAGIVLVQGAFSINYRYEGYLINVLNSINSINPQNIGSTIDPTNKAGIGTTSTLDLNGEQSAQGAVFSQGTVIDGSATITTGNPNKGTQVAAGSERGVYNDATIQALIDTYWTNVNTNLQQKNNARHLRPDMFKKGFDIVVTFGDFNEDALSNPDSMASVEKVFDCHIINYDKVLGIDGNPVTENYQFIAREIL